VGSDLRIPIRIEPEIEERYHVIQIEELTNSPFDWLLTLERASKLMLIDSCFSNLVEQLNMTKKSALLSGHLFNLRPFIRTVGVSSFLIPLTLLEIGRFGALLA
jgi:hypothetical protein